MKAKIWMLKVRLLDTLAAPAPAAIENPNVTAGIEILSDFYSSNTSRHKIQKCEKK